MAQTIKHAKVSGVPDGSDINQVQPTDWNADHVITGTVGWGEISGVPGTFPVALASTTEVLTGTDAAKTVTPDSLAALWEKGPDVPAAAIVSFGEGGFFNITGSAAISDIDFAIPKDGRCAWVRFSNAGSTLVPSASLYLPGVITITCAAGDTACFVQHTGDVVICVAYHRYDGTPMIKATTTEVLTGTDINKSVTSDALAALWERAADVVAAASLALGDGGYFVVTGNTGITTPTFATAKSGRRAWLYFSGTPLLTHSANFVLPGNANYQVVAGDRLELMYDGGTQYRALVIVRNDGKAQVPPAASEVPFTPTGTIAATNVQAAIAEVAAESTPYAGMRNRIINGDFAIDQRYNGSIVTATGPAIPYIMDRWQVVAAQTPGVISAQRVADATFLGDFRFQLAVATADASLAAGDYYILQQPIEGNTVKDLNWGSASAKPITVSFDVLGNAAYTLPLAIRNGNSNRTWLGSFPVTTTLTRVSLTVPGDTTGTWFKDEGIGMFILIALGAGTTYQGVAGWNAFNFMTLAGMSNVMAAAANLLSLKNFQVEVGSVATEFERRPYPQELQLCQRYFWKKIAGATPERIATGSAYAAQQTANVLRLPVRMRGVPTMIAVGLQANGQDSTNAAQSGGSEEALGFNVTVASGIAAGDGTFVTLKTAASSLIQADAEL